VAEVVDTFSVRPAVVSSLAAVAIHVALAALLPHARASHSFEGAQRLVQMVDVAEAPVAPLAPPLAAPALNLTPAPRGAAPGAPAVARAPSIVTRSPHLDAPSHEPAMLRGDFDLPAAGLGGLGAGDARPEARSGPVSLPSFAAPITAPPPPPIDHSRAPALARGGQWSCPWPAEADAIDHAVVVVSIAVDSAGRATKVDLLEDPGYGFGREARRCALREHYAPGLDRDGHAAPATTKPIRVRFSR